MVFGAEPRVFANSMPKAGTHLLTAFLDQLPQMRFSGLHGDLSTLGWGEALGEGGSLELDWERIARSFGTVRNGQYMTAHLPYTERLVRALETAQLRPIVILRDPRDVVVSDTFYISNLTRHPQHRRYMEQFKSFDERLSATITGADEDGYGGAMPSIATRIHRYEGWVGADGTLVTRFELLVGSHGGGDDSDQLAELRAISRHVGRPLDDPALERLAARVWNPRAATFRKAAVGDWRAHFTAEHRRIFDQQAGPAMEGIGYPREP